MTLPLPPACTVPASGCAGEDYVLVGTVPAVGPFPELRTFRCRRCDHVETVEAPRPPQA